MYSSRLVAVAQGIDDSLVAEVTPTTSPKIQAINDTLKVQRHLARTEQSGEGAGANEENCQDTEQHSSQGLAELRKVQKLYFCFCITFYIIFRTVAYCNISLIYIPCMYDVCVSLQICYTLCCPTPSCILQVFNLN